MSALVANKSLRFSARVYQNLLLAYPRNHREEYGSWMAQLFRDQCRDAWEEAGNWALLKLWLRVMPDLLTTSVIERVSALNERKNMFKATLSGRFASPVYAFFTVFMLVFLVVFSLSLLITFSLPESFVGVARVKVGYGSQEVQTTASTQSVQSTQSPRPVHSVYDPYFIQTEFEVIQSEAVLRHVVDSLDLSTEWGRKYSNGGPLKITDTLDLLKHQIDLRPVRNTTLVEIRAFSDNAEEAAKLANAVAEAYQAFRVDQERERVLISLQTLNAAWKEQEASINAAWAELDRLRTELNLNDTETQVTPQDFRFLPYAKAKDRLEGLRQLRTSLGMQIAQQQTDLSLPRTSPVYILDHAIANHRPVRPNKPLNIILGAFLGLVLGIIAGGGIAGISIMSRRNSQPRSDGSTLSGARA